jgi:hypothetical protein
MGRGRVDTNCWRGGGGGIGPDTGAAEDDLLEGRVIGSSFDGFSNDMTLIGRDFGGKAVGVGGTGDRCIILC